MTSAFTLYKAESSFLPRMNSIHLCPSPPNVMLTMTAWSNWPFDDFQLFLDGHAADAKATAQRRKPIILQQLRELHQNLVSLPSKFPLRENIAKTYTHEKDEQTTAVTK